jgi:PKD repeat protein
MASRSRALLLVAVVAAAGCTTKKTEAPPLSGPSELSLSLSIAANPDILTQDGRSQSTIVVRARDGNAQPVPSLPVRLDIVVNGAVQDFGRLSAKDVATGGDGTATVIYTAPDTVDSVDRSTSVAITATPGGTDATGQTPRSITIKLVPPGVVTPPPGTAPNFVFTPDTPLVRQNVNFVADEDVNVVKYAWSFGDGSTATGRIVDHEFRDPGNYLVTLTTTDSTGAKASRSKDVQVGAGEFPTVDFTVSPDGPAVNETVFFNASATVPAAGRRIVSYSWDFGDGKKGTGVTTSHKFTTAASYTVNLTVTDDAGVKANHSKTVAINP